MPLKTDEPTKSNSACVAYLFLGCLLALFAIVGIDSYTLSTSATTRVNVVGSTVVAKSLNNYALEPGSYTVIGPYDTYVSAHKVGKHYKHNEYTYFDVIVRSDSGNFIMSVRTCDKTPAVSKGTAPLIVGFMSELNEEELENRKDHSEFGLPVLNYCIYDNDDYSSLDTQSDDLDRAKLAGVGVIFVLVLLVVMRIRQGRNV